MKTLDIIIVGAGGRGSIYADIAANDKNRANIVGVAEPRAQSRNSLVEKFNIPAENVYEDWKELAKRDRFADAVIIATQDRMHTAPVVQFAKMGYHILLEKPMAPSKEECAQIVEAAKASKKIFAVCHVLKYTPFARKIKEVLDSGAIGDLVSLDQIEPVGYWHMAHSFVRGHWRNEQESSFMLLAKACHDLDLIRYLVGKRCKSISSFGSLKHFKRANQPEGASDRCTACKLELECPYSAIKIYLGSFRKGDRWPTDAITTDLSEAGILNALHTGPYGRCVYACDNNVVDHQVVNMQFEDEITATFTMTGFSKMDHRRIALFGTKGELACDGTKITVFDFLTETTREIDCYAGEASLEGGHGGGDEGLIGNFIEAVREGDSSKIWSGIDESLESHLMVFAAEEARRGNCVVNLCKEKGESHGRSRNREREAAVCEPVHA